MELPVLLYRWVPQSDYPKIKTYSALHSDNEFTITQVTYALHPTGRDMSPAEYLSPSRGVGGNIIGFFEYEEYRPPHLLQGMPGKTTLSQTNIFFGREGVGQRNLLVIVPSLLPQVSPNILLAKMTGLEMERPIQSCQNLLKVAQLGTEMQTRTQYGQESEWNFIVGSEILLPGFLISFGKWENAMHNGQAIQNFVPTGIVNFNNLMRAVQGLYDKFVSSGKIRIPQTVDQTSCVLVKAGGRRLKKKTRKTRKAKK